jgi:uncharacterized protein (TIGR00730 family)
MLIILKIKWKCKDMLRKFLLAIKWFLVVSYEFFVGVFQVFYGVWQLSKLVKPRVTFFGGNNIKTNSLFAKLATKLAKELNDAGVSVITGGGSGIMQAANCGAQKGKGKPKTIGIYLNFANEKINSCLDIAIKIDSLVARSWLLMRYSEVYVFFPGGFGTLHEFMQLIVLISTRQINSGPIILVGSAYWQPLADWLDKLEKEKYFSIKGQNSMYILLDDFETIKCTVLGNCQFN